MDVIYLYNYINTKNNKLKEGFSIKDISFVPNKVAILLISFFAMYLCWDVNDETNVFIKIFYCIFAFIFSGIYLIYYYFVHFKDKQSKNDFNFI